MLRPKCKAKHLMIRGFLYPIGAACIVGCAAAKVTPRSVVTTTDPLSILALPEGLPIFCRVVETDPADAQRPPALREFRFGTPNEARGSWPREISVAFDSAKHRFMLIDDVNLGTGGSQSVFAGTSPGGDVLVGRFVATTVDSVALAGALARGDVAGSLAAIRPPVQRDLTPNEWAQARALAAWLWERRCGRSP